MKKVFRSALSVALLSSSLVYSQAFATESNNTPAATPDVLSNFSLSAQNSSQNIPNLTLVPNEKHTVSAPSVTPSQYVLKKITDSESLENTIPAPYGLPLSKKGLNDYSEKHRVKVDAPKLDQMINDNSDQYSGMYYNPDKGTIVVQITNDSKDLKEKTTKNIKNKDKIEFEITKYSKKEIDEAKKKIKAKATPGSVKALIPDTKNNKLIVLTAKTDNKELVTANKELLKSMVSDPGLLSITEGQISTQEHADETNFGNNIPTGAFITGNYHKESDGQTYANICTAGFYGKTNTTNMNVLVTSGHCSPVSSGGAWYQPWNDTPAFGNYYKRTFSSDPNGTDGTADAGYIALYPGFNVNPVVPYPSSTSTTPMVGYYTNNLVGDTVYLRGANSGGTTSGTIKYSNVDVWWGGAGYGYKENEVFAQGYTSIKGDSGGPILAGYRWDNGRGKYVWDLAGINTGTVTLSGYGPKIEDGTYNVYEKVGKVMSVLNMAGAYLAP